MTRTVPPILRTIAVYFLACESCRNALSQVSFGHVAGADFPVVFWNARTECVNVPGKLRLALPRDFQPALTSRQS